MSKGSEFEKHVAKMLSFWWTQDEDYPRDDIFYRTHGSGSRHTSRMKKKKTTANAAGDLMFIDDAGEPFIRNFIVEIKSGYTTTGRIRTKDIKSIIEKAKAKKQPIEKALRGYTAGRLKRSGETIDALDYIDSDKESVLMKWWKKLEKEREETNRKHSILIFKRDLKHICMMVHMDLWMIIVDFIPNKMNSLCMGDDLTVIFRFEEFITKVHPTFIEEIKR